jgi:hypothetical protein
MTQHELNIIKLVDLIHDIENTNCHVNSAESLKLLNGLVRVHSCAQGSRHEPYSQKAVGPAKDYVG